MMSRQVNVMDLILLFPMHSEEKLIAWAGGSFA